MNVLLMTSPAPSFSAFSTKEKRPPLGMGILIAVSEARGHTVFFDDQYLKPWPIFDTPSFLRRHKIDVVGIYSSTICLQGTLTLVRRLERLRRSGAWGGRIVIGGPHTSHGADSLPDCVDHICIGEGDITILDLIEGEENSRIVTGKKVEDMDSLPIPAWHHFIYRGYDWTSGWSDRYPMYTMNTSRGCPFACTFCSVKGVWGRTYRFMSPERIFEELAFMQKYYGMRAAYFREDHFTLNPGRTAAFCEGLLSRGMGLKWQCESRADSLSRPGVLELMARAGCEAIYLGVESGSQRMLDQLEKHETVEQFSYVFGECRRVGIRTYASMICGTPGERAEDIAETEAFLAKERPDFIGRNVFAGLPGSELYGELRKTGAYDYEDENGLLYPNGYEHRAMHTYGNDTYFKVVSRALGTPAPEGPNTVTRKSAPPLISIIISAYNAAPFVREALESMLNQTEGNFELLVVDDSSEDDTLKAITDVRDPRIFVHQNEKRIGLTATLNKLLPLARGEFLARMDADDVSYPGRLAAQVALMRECPDVWVCGGHFDVFTEQGQYTAYMPIGNDEIRASLLFFTPVPHPFVMLRAEPFRHNNIKYNPKMRYAQDCELWNRIAVKHRQARFANVNMPLGRYRNLPGSISITKQQEQSEYALRSRMQTFLALGLSATDRDLPLHGYLTKEKEITGKAELIQAFGWAAKLRDTNDKTLLFPQKEFFNILSARLIDLVNGNLQFSAASTKLLSAWADHVSH